MTSAASSAERLSGPVGVCVDRPLLSLDRPFTYDLPAELEAGVGSLVQVPFHGRASRGWVLGPTDDLPDTDARRSRRSCLRSRSSTSGGSTLFRWMSERYVAPLAAVIGRAVPPRVASEEVGWEAAASESSASASAPSCGRPVLAEYRGGEGPARRRSAEGDGAFVARPAPEDEQAGRGRRGGRVSRREAAGRSSSSRRRCRCRRPRRRCSRRSATGRRCSSAEASAPGTGPGWRSPPAATTSSSGRAPPCSHPWTGWGSSTWRGRAIPPIGRTAPRTTTAVTSRSREPGLEGAVCVLAAACPSAEASALELPTVTPAVRRWPPVEVVRPGPAGRASRLVRALGTDAPGVRVLAASRATGWHRSVGRAASRRPARRAAGFSARRAERSRASSAEPRGAAGPAVARPSASGAAARRTWRGGLAARRRSRSGGSATASPRDCPARRRSWSVDRTTSATSARATWTSWRSSTSIWPIAGPGSRLASGAWRPGWRRSAGRGHAVGRSCRRRLPATRSCRRSSAGTRIGSTRRSGSGGRRRPPGRRGRLPRHGVARSIETELRAFEPSTLLVSSSEGRTVCLLALDPERVTALGTRLRELAAERRRRPRRGRAAPVAHLEGDRRDPPHPNARRTGPPRAREAGDRVRAGAPDAVRGHDRDDGRGARRRPRRAPGRCLEPALRVRRRRDRADVHGEPRAVRRGGGAARGRRVSLDPRAVPRDAAVRPHPLSRAGSRREARPRWSARASSRGSSSTRPTTSTGCSTSTDSTTRAVAT